MQGMTLAQAQAQLQNWLDADAAVSRGQAYTIGQRQLTRADAAVITEKIIFWEGKVRDLTQNTRFARRGITQVIPR